MKVNLRSFNLYRDYFMLIYFFRCKQTLELSRIPLNHIQVQKEKENLAVVCLRPPSNVTLTIFRRSRALMTAKKCPKKRDARAE